MVFKPHYHLFKCVLFQTDFNFFLLSSLDLSLKGIQTFFFFEVDYIRKGKLYLILYDGCYGDNLLWCKSQFMYVKAVLGF